MRLSVEQYQKLQQQGRLKAKASAVESKSYERMNKTERRYAAVLESRRKAGEILWWDFEVFRLRLGPKCFYNIDFAVVNQNHEIEIHEVKGGFIRDDASVKLKAAAEKYPFLRFFLCQYKKRAWTVKRV